MDGSVQQKVTYGSTDNECLLMGVVENMDGGENFFGKRHLNVCHGFIISFRGFSNDT